MTIATTVAIKQFIRPNDRTIIALSYGSNVRYWKRGIAVCDTTQH